MKGRKRREAGKDLLASMHIKNRRGGKTGRTGRVAPPATCHESSATSRFDVGARGVETAAAISGLRSQLEAKDAVIPELRGAIHRHEARHEALQARHCEELKVKDQMINELQKEIFTVRSLLLKIYSLRSGRANQARTQTSLAQVSR